MNRNSRLSASAVRKASYGAALVLAGILGCSGSSDSPSGTGGSGTGGKTTSTGGSSTGGSSSNTGGSSTGGSDSSTGGSSDTGGSSSSTGGSSDTGGSSSGTGGSSSSTGGKGGASSSTGGKGGSGTSSTGGSSGGGASGSADCSSLKLCEDFETGTLDTKTWKLQQQGFTAGIVTDQAHSGTHSFHVNAPNSANSAFISETKTFPASDFWGRAWMRFKGPAGGHQMYIYVAVPGDQARLLNRLGSSEAFRVNFQKSDMFYTSTTNIPQETWFCYEWHVTASAIQVFKDGVQLTDIKPPGASGGTSLNFGFQRFQTGASGEIWYDDIAVGDSQIGCK